MAVKLETERERERERERQTDRQTDKDRDRAVYSVITCYFEVHLQMTFLCQTQQMRIYRR